MNLYTVVHVVHLASKLSICFLLLWCREESENTRALYYEFLIQTLCVCVCVCVSITRGHSIKQDGPKWCQLDHVKTGELLLGIKKICHREVGVVVLL